MFQHFCLPLHPSDMSKRVRKEESGVSMLVDALIRKGIKLVAVDFDQTFITFHSGGVWKDSVEKLMEKIRPCIKELVEHCLDRGVHVCIVTYFMQPWVIKEMLHKVYKSHADQILVQANTPDFREKHNHEFLGKEAHITSILTKLYNKEHLKIRPEEVILFDDDKENTDIAIRFGHMAFLVQDSVADINFEDFAKTICASEFRKSWNK